MINSIGNSNINFGSTWRIVEPKVFNSSVYKISSNNVLAPWTIRETKIAKGLYTRGIYDCSAFGITNGNTAVMMHICPTEPENFNLKKINEYFLRKIDLFRNEYLQGFILGGQADDPLTPKSMEFAHNFIDIFEKEKIPYSKFLGGAGGNDLAYFTDTDTFLIGNGLDNMLQKGCKNPLDAAKVIFDDVKLCEFDELSW